MIVCADKFRKGAFHPLIIV